MRYIRKYIKHFGFVNRVVWLTVKYNVWYIFSSNKQIIKFILYHNSKSSIHSINYNLSFLRDIEMKINTIINYLPIYKTCLIRAIVKATFIQEKFNYFIPISLGISFKDNYIKAHSWLFTDQLIISERYNKLN